MKTTKLIVTIIFAMAIRTATPVVAQTTSYTLSATAISVQPGQSVSVSWTSPGGSAKDWIGWFKVSDSNTAYDASRWRYTGGASSGSFTITAPTTVGAYEFRYLLNDGF